jgi:hypothetical protein
MTSGHRALAAEIGCRNRGRCDTGLIRVKKPLEPCTKFLAWVGDRQVAADIALEMLVRPLEATKLYRATDLSSLPFSTRADLAPLDGLVGQARAYEAIQFGTRVDRAGFNLFVSVRMVPTCRTPSNRFWPMRRGQGRARLTGSMSTILSTWTGPSRSSLPTGRAFVIAVLPWGARIDLDWCYANAEKPVLEWSRAELRPIVGTQVFGFAATEQQRIERLQDFGRAHPAGDIHAQRFTQPSLSIVLPYPPNAMHCSMLVRTVKSQSVRHRHTVSGTFSLRTKGVTRPRQFRNPKYP